jgi:hypothetical protein
MAEIIIPMPRSHVGQRAYLHEARRFNVLCCGRRWGKNVVAHRRVLRFADQPIAWYAPTYRMLAEDWRELSNRLAPMVTRKNESEHRLDLLGGGCVDMWSLDNIDSSRGRKYGHVIINEAAMVKDLMSAWNMVIRPTLADMRGGSDFLSTPKGLNGFYELWQQAEDHPDWARFHFRTDDNPHIHPEEIAAMRASLPERVVKQEIDAEFVEDGAFFQNVDNAAVLQQPDTPEQHQGHDLFMAMDWGKSGDYSVFGVGCRQCARVVDWDRFNKIDYIYQRERAASLRARWNPGYILPERNSIGEPNIELLVNDGWPIMRGPDDKYGFYTGPTTKPPLIEALAQAFILHGYLVPADAKPELTIYEVNVMPSGHSQFSAPSGQHDDWVMMLALLWHAMTNTNWLIS